MYVVVRRKALNNVLVLVVKHCSAVCSGNIIVGKILLGGLIPAFRNK